MTVAASLAGFCAGVLLASLALWLAFRSRVSTEAAVLRERVSQTESQRDADRRECERLRAENASLLAQLSEAAARMEAERKAAQEKLAVLDDAQKKLSDAFRALSAESLQQNNKAFLDLAQETLAKFHETAKADLETKRKAVEDIVKPVSDTLQKVDEKITELEKMRAAADAAIAEQVRNLAQTQTVLREETGRLVRALKAPSVRGNWGEIQLKRVVEIAGMVPYCDFLEQVSATTEEGRLRPDMIVRLPGGKNIVVDAKTPLDAYLRAHEAENDDERKRLLEEHGRQVMTRIRELSAKKYWDQFKPTPEFVVLFLPGEVFFSAALEYRPELIEEGVSQRVIPASPTTLIALLRAIAYGWQQEKIAQSAQRISELGRDLHERIRAFAEHMSGIGTGLERAAESYNKAVSSLESRVLVAARRFEELGVAGSQEIPEVAPVDKTFRSPSLPGKNTRG